jgi:hypothetical protein
MSIPSGLRPDDFAAELLDVLARERRSLELSHREGKGKHFTVRGIEVFLSHAREGSDLSFGRMLGGDDGREFPDHVKRVVEKKSDKLKRHKGEGRETWLVVYNTFWIAMALHDVRDFVLAALTPEYAHIDHFGVVSGDPPDDAWLATIR